MCLKNKWLRPLKLRPFFADKTQNESTAVGFKQNNTKSKSQKRVRIFIDGSKKGIRMVRILYSQYALFSQDSRSNLCEIIVRPWCYVDGWFHPSFLNHDQKLGERILSHAFAFVMSRLQLIVFPVKTSLLFELLSTVNSWSPCYQVKKELYMLLCLPESSVIPSVEKVMNKKLHKHELIRKGNAHNYSSSSAKASKDPRCNMTLEERKQLNGVGNCLVINKNQKESYGCAFK